MLGSGSGTGTKESCEQQQPGAGRSDHGDTIPEAPWASIGTEHENNLVSEVCSCGNVILSVAPRSFIARSSVERPAVRPCTAFFRSFCSAYLPNPRHRMSIRPKCSQNGRLSLAVTFFVKPQNLKTRAKPEHSRGVAVTLHPLYWIQSIKKAPGHTPGLFRLNEANSFTKKNLPVTTME